MKRYLGRNMRTGELWVVDADSLEAANYAFEISSEKTDKYQVVCLDDFYHATMAQQVMGGPQ